MDSWGNPARKPWPAVDPLLKINDEEPTKYQGLRPFEELTTINPNRRIKLETVPDRYTTRIMDLMTPLGMGQRGFIVAPPRAGKTTLLATYRRCGGQESSGDEVDDSSGGRTSRGSDRNSAHGSDRGNDGELERQRHQEPHPDRPVRGRTREALGRSRQGCVHPARFHHPHGARLQQCDWRRRADHERRYRRSRDGDSSTLFSAARNTEEAGSLTIVATALIETGSRMDELIFQEFKGTGNMELVLDRKISDQRIYPAVDIFLSGTRREELLMPPWELDKINMIRRGLAGHKPGEAIERLLMFVKKFPTNTQMLKEIPG